VVEHSPHHPKGEGLSPVAATDTRRYKMAKKSFEGHSDSTVVENIPHEPKVKGLRATSATFTERVKWQKSCLNARPEW
jgi:hypothetical protein